MNSEQMRSLTQCRPICRTSPCYLSTTSTLKSRTCWLASVTEEPSTSPYYSPVKKLYETHNILAVHFPWCSRYLQEWSSQGFRLDTAPRWLAIWWHSHWAVRLYIHSLIKTTWPEWNEDSSSRRVHVSLWTKLMPWQTPPLDPSPSAYGR